MIVVRRCVLTFSELEKEVKINADDLNMKDCVRWARKESAIRFIIGRLRNKASLLLMLNVLIESDPICKLSQQINGSARHSISEVKALVNWLCGLVNVCSFYSCTEVLSTCAFSQKVLELSPRQRSTRIAISQIKASFLR